MIDTAAILERIDAIMRELAELRAMVAAGQNVEISHHASGKGCGPDNRWTEARRHR